jgi:hypothetical protein
MVSAVAPGESLCLRDPVELLAQGTQKTRKPAPGEPEQVKK